MCSGYFIPPEDLEGSPSGPASTTQVALGGEQGAIYIMGNFQVSAGSGSTMYSWYIMVSFSKELRKDAS